MSQTVIGIDFGTLSGRAVLADAADGRVQGREAVTLACGSYELTD